MSNIVTTFLAASDDDDVPTLCNVLRDDSDDEDEEVSNDDIDDTTVEVNSIIDASKTVLSPDTISPSIDGLNVFKEIGLDVDELNSPISPHSEKQLQDILKIYFKNLTKNRCISMELMRFLRASGMIPPLSNNATSTTPDDHPDTFK